MKFIFIVFLDITTLDGARTLTLTVSLFTSYFTGRHEQIYMLTRLKFYMFLHERVHCTVIMNEKRFDALCYSMYEYMNKAQ